MTLHGEISMHIKKHRRLEVRDDVANGRKRATGKIAIEIFCAICEFSNFDAMSHNKIRRKSHNNVQTKFVHDRNCNCI